MIPPKKVINKIWNFSGIDIFLSVYDYVGGGERLLLRESFLFSRIGNCFLGGLLFFCGGGG